MKETRLSNVEEYMDDNEIFQIKIQKLIELISKANYCVVYTSAGISTSAGLPDYRGPNGVWTLKQNNDDKWINLQQKIYDKNIVPSSTHTNITKLVEAKLVKTVLSTNIDGLHIASGLTRNVNLIEMHGNKFVEECQNCNKEYYRTYTVSALLKYMQMYAFVYIL